MPGGVIPDQDESGDRLRCEFLATRGQKVDGDRADGTPINKAQEQLVSRLRAVAQQHSITSQCFGIGVLFAALDFLKPFAPTRGSLMVVDSPCPFPCLGHPAVQHSPYSCNDKQQSNEANGLPVQL